MFGLNARLHAFILQRQGLDRLADKGHAGTGLAALGNDQTREVGRGGPPGKPNGPPPKHVGGHYTHHMPADLLTTTGTGRLLSAHDLGYHRYCSLNYD